MHFSLLSITLALPLLTASAPLPGDNQIDRAMTISPQAIQPTTTPIIKNRATQKKVSSGGTTSTSHRSTPSGSPPGKNSTCSAPKVKGKGKSIRNRTTDDECDSDDDSISPSDKSISSEATIEHLSGSEDITLFHGTPHQAIITKIQKGIRLEKAALWGDLHDKRIEAIDGAFYMTDGLYAAAQHACQRSINVEKPEDEYRIVYVAEFQLLGTGLKVKEFKDFDEMKRDTTRIETKVSPGKFKYHVNPALVKLMAENDMITSPMHDESLDRYLSDYFWQYAVLKQKVVDDGKLKFKKSYTIYCDNVKVRHIPAETYTNGQKTDATIKSGVFEAMVNTFTTQPKEGPKKDVWQERTYYWMTNIVGVDPPQ